MQDFTMKQTQSESLQFQYDNLLAKKLISKSRRESIRLCGKWLQFAADESLDKKRLYRAQFCKYRFCPMCGWRKMLRESVALTTMTKYIRKEKLKEFVFLTLTAPNVTADRLADEISHYTESFKRMIRFPEVAKVIKGYARKLEVTYNANTDTYHPHYHVLIAVNRSYFKDRTYLNHAKWTALWQQAARNPDITQVDVRKVKIDDGIGSEMMKQIAKITHYHVKASELAQLPMHAFETLHSALYGKRSIAFGGLFAEAMSLYESGELDYLKEQDLIEYVYLLTYKWAKSEYVEYEKRLLTMEERAKINQLKPEDDYDIDD